MLDFLKRNDIADQFLDGAKRDYEARRSPPQHRSLPRLTVGAMGPAPVVRARFYDGEKFAGGFGATDLFTIDYWTLRARSAQLYRTNLYARGIIRRLVTNEINTGLHLEATPEEKTLKRDEDELSDWSEDVENRFALWANSPKLCDQKQRLTFGQLQALARNEALVSGDCLVVLRQDQRTRLPRIQLISGNSVQSPLRDPRSGNKIVHGVELDANRRHVAYWVQQDDGTTKRLPAFGEKSGRRIAWLIYGGDNRLDEVRGTPILSMVLQSLKEIDRYRDSIQRKAAINSNIAGWVEKTEDKMGTNPITNGGGAVRKGTQKTVDATGQERTFAVAEQVPGFWIEELQHGEKIHAFNQQVNDEKFGDFEKAIVATAAWHFEIPPEILWLHFSNNYSASQAAINEFKMYLDMRRDAFGKDFCQPIYVEWLLAEVLNGKIKATGLLEALRDPMGYAELAAWVSSDWSGHIKPAVDRAKLVRGFTEEIEAGVTTRARVSRELSGQKYSKVVKQLKRENELLADALAPLQALEVKERAPLPDTDETDRQENDERTSLHVVDPTGNRSQARERLVERNSTDSRAAKGA